MLHAANRGKFRARQLQSPETNSIEYRDLEDHLTAAVFTRLSYLAQLTIERVLQRAIVTSIPAIAFDHSNTDDDHVNIEFWPRYKDRSGVQNAIEPDAIFQIGQTVLLIEAKRYDTSQQESRQIAAEWISWSLDSENEKMVTAEYQHIILMVGGLSSIHEFHRIAAETKSRLDQCNHELQIAPSIAWISWTNLARSIRAEINLSSGRDARVLRDADLALTMHGFGTLLTVEDVLRHWSMLPKSAPRIWPDYIRPTKEKVVNYLEEWRQHAIVDEAKAKRRPIRAIWEP